MNSCRFQAGTAGVRLMRQGVNSYARIVLVIGIPYNYEVNDLIYSLAKDFLRVRY